MIREGSIRIPFRYASGQAGSRFLAALRDEGRILGSRCGACGRVACPARSFCAACGEGCIETVEVGPEGLVLSWTEVPGRGVFALVRLDGADGAMMHRLLPPASRVEPGMRVRARFTAERSGHILDIEGFEPTTTAPEPGGRR